MKSTATRTSGRPAKYSEAQINGLLLDAVYGELTIGEAAKKHNVNAITAALYVNNHRKKIGAEKCDVCLKVMMQGAEAWEIKDRAYPGSNGKTRYPLCSRCRQLLDDLRAGGKLPENNNLENILWKIEKAFDRKGEKHKPERWEVHQ
jgi:hypothetical protein